ncbi:MAG: hypothetical protein MUC58_13200 [Rhizobiaceae bacterium]|nr:hypothetical protein [Rhizobiaceae bacterium]
MSAHPSTLGSTPGRSLGEVFAALLAQADTASDAAELSEAVGALAEMVSVRLAALAPQADRIAPRKLSGERLQAALARLMDETVLVLADEAGDCLVLLEPSAIRTLAAILGGAPRPTVPAGEPTALERAIVVAFADSLQDADGGHLRAVTDRKARIALAQARTAQNSDGVEIALHEARGRGGAPVITGAVAARGGPHMSASTPSVAAVEARLGHATVPVAHKAACGLRPLSALHQLRIGDILPVGPLCELAVKGEVRGAPSHCGTVRMRCDAAGDMRLVLSISERFEP